MPPAPVGPGSRQTDHLQAHQIRNISAARDVAVHDHAREPVAAFGAELSGGVGIGDQDRLVAEDRIDFPERENHLISIRTGGDDVFAQDVVLSRGCDDAACIGEQIPQRRSGVGIADRDASGGIGHALGRDGCRRRKIIDTWIGHLAGNQDRRE